MGYFTLEKPVVPFPTVWMDPVHHHGIEPRPTSCYPHSIPPDPFPRMLVCQCHTQTTRLHPRPHLPPIWNCLPTCPAVLTHPRSQHPLTINPPNSTFAPAALNSFDSVSCILLLRKATVIWAKVYISVSFHLYVLATLTRGPDNALVCLRKAPLCHPFHFCLLI